MSKLSVAFPQASKMHQGARVALVAASLGAKPLCRIRNLNPSSGQKKSRNRPGLEQQEAHSL